MIFKIKCIDIGNLKYYNICMKKFWKVLLITVLVLGTIAGTCWIFYSQFKKKRDSYANALNYLNSSDRVEFNAMVAQADAVSGMSRFGYMVTNLNKLDEVNTVLTPYLSKANEADVDQNKIYKQFKEFEEMQPEIKDMIDEYILKSTSVATFDENSGANPLYRKLSLYIVNYAEYLFTISGELQEIFNRKIDTKFYMIEIFLNVTMDTFSNLKETEGSLQIEKPRNILKATETLKFNNSKVSYFSTKAVQFREAYLLCDIKDFAANYSTYLDTALVLNGDPENDAMFYLKNMLEV